MHKQRLNLQKEKRMPVFDFSNTPVSDNNDFVCTYTTFASNERTAAPEKPILILDNSKRRWSHHSCGIFSNQSRRITFEFDESDGKLDADILQVDARFVHLLKWLGKNHIQVRLSGQNREDGYAVYKIRETLFGGKGRGKLSADDGFLQFMIERLFARRK